MMNAPQTRKRVYDLPTRLFHWGFAALFLSAFGIAKTIDSESPRFVWHMLLGLGLGTLALLRILWGFIGSKHARFKNFPLHPQRLLEYFKGIVRNTRDSPNAGHNPASSWLTLTLLSLALALVSSGLLMSAGYAKEFLEEAHEVFATVFILSVGAHLAGLVIHTIRLKDPIPLSMIDGKKRSVPDSEVIPSSHWGAALLGLGLMGAFGTLILRGYEPTQRIVRLGPLVLPLGFERESDEGRESKKTKTPLSPTKSENADD